MEKSNQNKIKQKCDIHGIDPKSYRQIVEKDQIGTTITHAHEFSLSCSILLRHGLYLTTPD